MVVSADEAIIPSSLFQKAGVKEQVEMLKTGSEVATNILSLSHEYRQTASQTRIQTPVAPKINHPQNSSLKKASTTVAANKIMTKTKPVISAAEQKRQGLIQLYSSLWVAKSTRTGGEKPHNVNSSLSALCRHSPLQYLDGNI